MESPSPTVVTATREPSLPPEPGFAPEPVLAPPHPWEVAFEALRTDFKTMKVALGENARSFSVLKDQNEQEVAYRKALQAQWQNQSGFRSWLVILEAAFYAMWFLFIILLCFVPVYQALFRHYYGNVWGAVIGGLLGWLFYLVVQKRLMEILS